MKIAIANLFEIDPIWPLISERLQQAFAKTGGDLTSGELWQMCRSGQAFLIVAFEKTELKAAMIVQFQKWDKPVLRCLALVGFGMEQWLEAGKDFIWGMAKDNGAQSFVFEGREGWKATLPEARRLRSTWEISL